MNDRTEQSSAISQHDEESVADDRAMHQLLDRPLTDDDLRDATQRVAQPRSQPARDVASALLFRIGGEQLAVPATDVARVTRVSTIRRIPHRGNHIIRGLCNIDGELVLCGSLRELLELPDGPPAGNTGKPFPVAEVARLQESQKNDRTLASPATKSALPRCPTRAVDGDQRRMVVLGPESNRWAVKVDCVLGVRYFETASCKPPPVTVRQAMRCFTTSLLPIADDDVATLLDVSQVLYGFKAALT